LSVDLEARVHDAASRLIHQIAFAETRRALHGLREAGVIGEDLAATLALELNEALIRPIRSEMDRPAIEARQEPTKARPAPPEAPRPQVIGKKRRRKKTRPDADVVLYCPICMEQGIQTRLSAGSVGCIKHWREVKRRARNR